MSVTLDGYRTTRVLRNSGSTQVFEAVREHDGRRVVAKVYDIEANEGLRARVQHEFRALEALDIEGVVRTLALERAGSRLALVRDRGVGIPLAAYCLGRALSVVEFLDVAIQITAALAGAHARGVIHRDLKPTNLLIDPSSKRVAIAGFGVSLLVDSERERINDPSIIELTLPYLAPEQTGRTGRGVDFRTDLYSLGVVFYELLTGRRPFEGDTALELIHAHLARHPARPERRDLPPPLVSIVLKLLMKASEHRYQSASGLHHDLTELRSALLRNEPLDRFPLGRHDIPSSLQLPRRLYGRASEIDHLIAGFRQAARGSTRLWIISGPSGIGKTALVEQLVEPALGARGYFAYGRCDREAAEQPFTGVVAALTELADQLLTESDDRLGNWRTSLREQLGGLSSVLTRLIPRYEAILGPEPLGADTSDSGRTGRMGIAEFTDSSHRGQDGRPRVLLACMRLLVAVARPEHPLVLAIDDLQWADPGSCELLEMMLDQPDLALLIVGTLGSSRPDLPIVQLFGRLHEVEHDFEVLELGPLSRSEVTQLVADATGRGSTEVESLVDVVGARASGSPMLTRQLLIHLADLGLLRPTAEGWAWDPASLESAGIPVDSLEMMTAKLERLTTRPRELLTMAAVLGERFDVQFLEALAGPELVGEGLHVLLDEGLLTPTNPRQYVFSHSQIRQAAYAKLGNEQLRRLHLAVGQLRLADLGLGDLGDHVFDLVDHLDRGHGLLPLGLAPGSEPDQRAAVALAETGDVAYELAELNGLAGYKALESAAAHLALQYFEVGAALRGPAIGFPRPGEAGYPLALSLELGLAQALALAGHSTRADACFGALVRRPLADIDRWRVLIKRYQMLAAAGRVREGVEFGLTALRELGVGLPESPNLVEVGVSLVRMAAALRRHDLGALHSRPQATDARARVQLELLAAITATVYTTNARLFVVLVERQLSIFFEHGRHPVVPLALVQAGLLVANGLEMREFGRAVCDAGESLVEREDHTCPRQRVAVVAAFSRLWMSPHREGISALRRATSMSLEAGDLEFAGYSLALQAALELLAGGNLAVIEEEVEAGIRWLQHWHGHDPLGGLTVVRGFCARLTHDAPLGDDVDPLGYHAILPGLSDASRQNAHLFAALLLFLLDRRSEALTLLAENIDKLERSLLGSWHIPVGLTLHGIALAVDYPRQLRRAKRATVERLERDAKRLRKWAKQAPANFEHHASLLEAELAAIRGNLRLALELLARARRQAAAQRSSLFEALALERTAELCRHHGLDDLALGPAKAARDCWRHWGAAAKVAALERRWPELREPVGDFGAGAGASSRLLDTSTLLKASQAIAEDIRLEEVVDRVLASALENAGAERGALVLPGRRGLGLAALVSASGVSQSFLHEPLALEEVSERLPVSVIHWAERTREAVVIDDASADLRFANDAYVRGGRVRSVLCLPIVKHNRLVGLLYLENRLSTGSFTAERLELLRLLTAQAANAIENAQLYEALRTSEVRWRSLVEGLPDIVALLDRSGRVEFINHLGDDRARSHTLGSLADEFLAADHQPAAREAMARVVRRGESAEFEMSAALPGGELRWYVSRLAPIIVDGHVERVIAVATDITQRRQADHDRAQLEAQLRQQQRLESIGTLASGVAHEINNPVQGIMNYAELIAESPGVGGDVRDYAGEIEHEAQRVATIVRNLLAFSRQEVERGARPTTVGEIVDGALSLIRSVLRKDQISLGIHIPEGLPELVCRPQQVQQVLMNLVTNARDALNHRYPQFDELKRMAIEASAFERDGRDWIRLSVEDLGGGVAEESASRIFDPFFTTKGRDQGTGLGLAVSHGIVSDHGGELRLDNRPGIGARFDIELPADGSGVEVRQRVATAIQEPG